MPDERRIFERERNLAEMAKIHSLFDQINVLQIRYSNSNKTTFAIFCQARENKIPKKISSPRKKQALGGSRNTLAINDQLRIYLL